MARNGLAHSKPFVWNDKYFMWKGEYIHRQVWEEAYGPIPQGFIMHHINGDKLDNRLKNLTLVTRASHCRLHSPRLGFTSPPVSICAHCGRSRNEREILSQPHRHKCNKCRAYDNAVRRKSNVSSI